ncbi:MAG: TolC family protein [Candidatus Omnitrophota bacterium]
MTLRYSGLIAVVMSLILVRGAFSEELNIPPSLNLLVEEALLNNPRIQAARGEWEAAEYKVQQVKAPPNPVVKYAHFGQNIETRVGPEENIYGISQKIPFPGKLELQGKTQFIHSEVLKEKYEAIKRGTIKDVKFVFYDLYWVDRAIQITEEEKSILESLENVARKKYETRLAPQQDVIKAQVELSMIIDRLFTLGQNRLSLLAKLNSILNRSEGRDLGRTGSVELSEFGYTLEELHEMARVSRQELLAANLDVKKAEYEKSLAGLDFYPDVTLGFDYIQIGSGHTAMPNDGQDAWLGSVAVDVPIWFDRLSAQLREKNLALKASRDNYNELENSVRYEVSDLFYKIITYRNIVNLYKTALIPQTVQSFEAAKTSYETGRVDFLNWLDAERTLLQTRLAYHKAVIDYQKSIAFLERIVGRDL